MTKHLGAFEFSILSELISHPNDAYGGSLQERLSERLERDVSFGAIYTTLERLEQKGYVSSRWGEPTAERGGRRKRYYQIEASGRKAVHDTAALFASSFAFGPAFGAA